MAADYSEWDRLAGLFRKNSPNIAKAFDEAKRHSIRQDDALTALSSTAVTPNTTFAVPPTPPWQSYTIPGGAAVCTTIGQLETALAGGSAVDVKVMNGSYSRATPLAPAAAHRIWCETYNGVTFNFGFDWQYKQNWEMHGGIYNVPDSTHAVGGSSPGIITNWFGTSSQGFGAKISDVTLDGNSRAVHSGIFLGCPHGAVIQRVLVTNVREYGIRLMAENLASSTLTTLTDLDVSGVYNTPRGASNGTAEAGIWVGHQVTNPVLRLRCRDIGWSGLLTINFCRDTTFGDLIMDNIYGTIPPGHTVYTGTGIYMEYHTKRCIFERVEIGPTLRQGIIQEWFKYKQTFLSSGVTLPAATLNVYYAPAVSGESGFPTSGTVYVGNAYSGNQAVAYTGRTNTTLTGCTGGSGTFSTGDMVALDDGGYAAGIENTIRHGRIRAADSRATDRMCIFLDMGTVDPIVTDVLMSGADHAGLVDQTRRGEGAAPVPSVSNTMLTYSQLVNDGLPPGVSLVSYVHPNDS